MRDEDTDIDQDNDKDNGMPWNGVGAHTAFLGYLLLFKYRPLNNYVVIQLSMF